MTEYDSDTAYPTQAGAGLKTVKSAVMLALVAAVFFAGGVYVGGDGSPEAFNNIPLLGDGLSSEPDTEADLSEFWKAWNALEADFIQTHASTTLPSAEERVWGAIAGLTSSYGDPYTVYLPPSDAKIFQEDISGNFGGAGMEIGVGSNGILTVIAPLKGTPAERAGIRAGDGILSIDGKSTEGMPTDEAVKLIRGEVGTQVAFVLLRDGTSFPQALTRDVISVPTLDHSLDSATGVYTIALYSFTENSPALFANAITGFKASGSDKLIIDLRGNPGGYLHAAIDMASRFLPKGAVVVTEDYQDKREGESHRSLGFGGVPEGTKVVVLIDRGSASASEILAGALKDNGVATLIGTRSFGKGSVQELIDIDDGALKITVARWLTPSGVSISDGGLAADIEVNRTPEDYAAGRDPQKERAIEFLTTGK
ncbi:MAG: S41 family peptidase [Candidatus Pacebacteria bacterium]|nr:S41 family peptidase [Candidatus Paceibacterota bacterium]MBP9840569.1 S41 family peptidase [Candidatus Paceibacterota bacterium]